MSAKPAMVLPFITENTSTNQSATPKSAIDFLTLISKHFENEKDFDLKRYIYNYHLSSSSFPNYKADIDDDDKYTGIESRQLDLICLSDLLPGTKFITSQSITNIVYQGVECEAEETHYYRYGDYIFIYHYSSCGDDCDVLVVQHTYGTDLLEFYRTCVTVIPIGDFHVEEMITLGSELEFIIKLFSEVYGEDGQARFQDYMARSYLALSNK